MLHSFRHKLFFNCCMYVTNCVKEYTSKKIARLGGTIRLYPFISRSAANILNSFKSEGFSESFAFIQNLRFYLNHSFLSDSSLIYFF